MVVIYIIVEYVKVLCKFIDLENILDENIITYIEDL